MIPHSSWQLLHRFFSLADRCLLQRGVRDGLCLTSVAKLLRVVVDRTQLIEEFGVPAFVGILQSARDRCANQMCPAELMLAAQARVSRVVIRHADAAKELSRNSRRGALFARDSAALKHMHGSRKNPRRARLFADFPAGFVDVHDHPQGQGSSGESARS